MIRRPPRSTLFPYTTRVLSRDALGHDHDQLDARLDRLEHGVARERRGHGHDRPVGNGAELLDELRDGVVRSEEHTSELQSRQYIVCRLLLEKNKNTPSSYTY